MKNWISSNKFYLLGAILGGIGGFIYWKWVGCASGTCRITSRPLNSTLYFALIGSLLGGMIPRKAKNKVDQ